MGLIASKKNGVVIPPLEEGTYTAVCIGIVDLGEQFNERYKKYQEAVSLTFEVVGETVERGNGPEPRWVSREYAKTLGDKSNLYKDLSKWAGALSEEELQGFDLTSLLGKSCLISVLLKESTDGTKNNKIEGVMALPKGMQQPKAQSALFLFNMDDPATYPVLDDLPRFMREKVERSTTWARLHAGSEDMGMDEDSLAQDKHVQDKPTQERPARPVQRPSAQERPARVPPNIDPETGEYTHRDGGNIHVPF
jgi:hypothetical protein